MNKAVRAWKDPAFRATLSAGEQAEFASPAGLIELSGTDLDAVAGGGGSGKSHSGKSRSSGKSHSGKSRSSGKSHSGKSHSGKSH